MDSESDANLRGDPKRQAIASLQGYSYQIWQSLYRWLHLSEDQALVLEGAEDMDLMGPGRAESIQVKIAGRISLRSKPALESIIHFWQHQQGNPDLAVFFRLLTTAKRTSEQSSPFGETCGLDYWDLCKFARMDLRPLRTFLVAQPSVPIELRRFVSESTDEELREGLIKRIEWDTDSKPQSYISDLVSNRVANYGYRVHYLPPSESDRVVPTLLKHVWDVVLSSQSRRLLFSDFMRVFEETISEQVSRTELRQLRHMALLSNARGHEPHGSSGFESFSPSDSVLETITPPLNDKLVVRLKLVTNLLQLLNSKSLLVLTGSTGMGKSILANTIATIDGSTWRRLSTRGLQPNEIRDRLRYAAHAVEGHPDGTSFIIDDLNFDKGPAAYEEPLAKLIYAIILRRGRMLITTQGTLPMRIMNVHDLSADCTFDVPTLDEEEVRELAANHGCPTGPRLKAWTRIIAIQTSRHPLLAHARVRSLEAKGWPPHTESDLGPPDDLGEIRRQIRGLLRELLPSEEARLLAYRLSIILGRFRRHDALQFGRHQPTLNAAGEAFDSLIGPWVERAGEHYFRLSPLLDYAADENFTANEVKDLHATAARSFISQEAIGPVELNAILFHGLISETVEPLANAAMCTFRVDEEYWPDLRMLLDWFGNWRLQPGEKLLQANPLVSTLLRRLQFKIVNKTDDGRALRVAAAWEQEIEGWDGSASYPNSQAAMRLMFLNDLLFSFETPLTIKAIVAYLAKAIPIGQAADHFFPGHELDEDLTTSPSRVFNAHTYVGVAIARCRTGDAVIEFLTALGNLKDDDSRVILEILRNDDRLSVLLIDQIWIDEAKASEADWTLCINRIEWVIEFALDRKLTSLLVAAYRAKATVLEEYVHDSESALNTIIEGESKVGNLHPVLEDYRAKILVLEKRYEEALFLWDGTLSGLGEEHNPVRTFSYRDAEICAGTLGDWRKAGQFALEGAKSARQMLGGVVPDDFKVPDIELLAAGFKADYAFAQWKSGDRGAAIESFAAILEDFDHLPDPSKDLKSNMLHKRVGYAIGWLNHELLGGTDIVEPPPGCFSNQEVHELVNDLPMQPVPGLWFLLAKVEYLLDLGDSVFRRFEQRSETSNLLSIRSGYADLLLDHSLRSFNFISLVSVFTKSLATLRAYTAERGACKDQLSDTLALTSYLFAALIKLVGVDQYPSVPVDKWREEATECGALTDALNDWLRFVERSVNASHPELVSTLHSTSVASEIRLVSALLLSASATSNPEERFYANILLVTTNLYDTWLKETEAIIGPMVADKWLCVAKSERFSLISPSLNADVIARACTDDSCHGIRKAARVLLAAKNAVRTTISGETLESLQERAA